MLPQSAFRNRHKNRGRPPEKSIPAYLKWLRGRPCALGMLTLTYENCHGRIEAAHTPGSHDKGMGTKSSDHYAIPACSGHHHTQHQKGWRTFAATFGIEPEELAEQYFGAWLNTPMGAKWIMERDQ